MWRLSVSIAQLKRRPTPIDEAIHDDGKSPDPMMEGPGWPMVKHSLHAGTTRRVLHECAVQTSSCMPRLVLGNTLSGEGGQQQPVPVALGSQRLDLDKEGRFGASDSDGLESGRLPRGFVAVEVEASGGSKR